MCHIWYGVILCSEEPNKIFSPTLTVEELEVAV